MRPRLAVLPGLHSAWMIPMLRLDEGQGLPIVLRLGEGQGLPIAVGTQILLAMGFLFFGFHMAQGHQPEQHLAGPTASPHVCARPGQPSTALCMHAWDRHPALHACMGPTPGTACMHGTDIRLGIHQVNQQCHS